MLFKNDFPYIVEYLKSLGISRNGYSVDIPEQSLFGYRNSTHDLMVSTHVHGHRISMDYTYSIIINEEPIDPETGKGIFQTEKIEIGMFGNLDEIKPFLEKFFPEIFRDENIDSILNN